MQYLHYFTENVCKKIYLIGKDTNNLVRRTSLIKRLEMTCQQHRLEFMILVLAVRLECV